MTQRKEIFLTDLAMSHEFYGVSGVKRYCQNTEDVAGHLLRQAGINLNSCKRKPLLKKVEIFLRKINPTWED